MYARSKTPSMGTPSVYSIHASHLTLRSSNLRSTRSMKSLRVPWYQRPILKDAYFLDTQRGALIIAFYSLFLSIFTLATSAFDTYCLAMAVPGSTHYGYYVMSYQFVYVGSAWVRNLLILFSLFSFVAAAVIFVTSLILISALRKEHEKRIVPWLFSFAAFVIFRFIAWTFSSIANDPIFGYNITMIILGAVFTVINVYGWLLVYSLYLELFDLTKLEDLAHLRIGTMASLNASTTHSLAGSRPTTPHSTVSTAPV
ncbi:uncharacterized protein LOC126838468 [Adelges cooleyi]|uniref:uncharacterized protein LOC126838468 n=1 Tax=Adelges cooleyi TaxID=133065 RepID=UPI0021807FC3|nr:uncharacterized protein LOC126838468 [Adelges cooleyi]